MTHDLETLISGYEAGVRHPDVSGMEHLNLLQVRSRLSRSDAEWTEAQRERVRKADQDLFEHAGRFLRAIQQIADLAAWRAQENAPTSHWWWYLDVITNLPIATMKPMKATEVVVA